MPRRTLVFPFALALVAGCAGAPRTIHPDRAASEWVSIFNGRDLTGWRANRTPEAFTVSDGVLRVNAIDKSSHLFYVGSDTGSFARIKNFELELEARSEPSANSGIYFHSDPATAAGSEYHLGKGYEVQLNNTAIERKKTGSLYNVVDLPVSPVDETKWFTMRIRVNGKWIGVWLDGKPVVEYVEPDSVEHTPSRASRRIDPSGGGIAIQAHDPRSVYYFRNIRLKRLPDAP
jgi:hypothetical protein